MDIPGHIIIPREEVQNLLMLYINHDGAFLVRPSESNPGSYSIGVIHRGAIKHFKIHVDHVTGGYFIAKKKFLSVRELVIYYMNKPIRTKKSEDPVLLQKPIKKVERATLVPQQQQLFMQQRAVGRSGPLPPAPAQAAQPSGGDGLKRTGSMMNRPLPPNPNVSVPGGASSPNSALSNRARGTSQTSVNTPPPPKAPRPMEMQVTDNLLPGQRMAMQDRPTLGRTASVNQGRSPLNISGGGSPIQSPSPPEIPPNVPRRGSFPAQQQQQQQPIPSSLPPKPTNIGSISRGSSLTEEAPAPARPPKRSSSTDSPPPVVVRNLKPQLSLSSAQSPTPINPESIRSLPKPASKAPPPQPPHSLSPTPLPPASHAMFSSSASSAGPPPPPSADGSIRPPRPRGSAPPPPPDSAGSTGSTGSGHQYGSEGYGSYSNDNNSMNNHHSSGNYDNSDTSGNTVSNGYKAAPKAIPSAPISFTADIDFNAIIMDANAKKMQDAVPIEEEPLDNEGLDYDPVKELESLGFYVQTDDASADTEDHYCLDESGQYFVEEEHSSQMPSEADVSMPSSVPPPPGPPPPPGAPPPPSDISAIIIPTEKRQIQSAAPDPRDGLLDAIRGHASGNLRKVEVQEKPALSRQQSAIGAAGAMADSLAKIVARYDSLGDSDDEVEECEEDGWSD